MSVENEKVCRNCKHKMDKGDNNEKYCWCNLTGRYLSYDEVMLCEFLEKKKEEINKKFEEM